MGIRLRVATVFAVIVVLAVGGWFLVKDLQIDVLNPSGVVAAQQRDLLIFTVFLSALVVVPVFILLAIFSLRYRAGNKKAKYTPDWAENRVLESLWWGIPMAIIAILAVLTWQTSHSLDPYKKLDAGKSLEVQVVALQWKWLFLYPEHGVATLNHLPIPVDTPVHFTMTANAPMSAFWIPALGSQVYAMSGMSSQLNLNATKVGEYKGYTTNVNGKGYAGMTFLVKALKAEHFDSWTKQATANHEIMNEDAYKKLTSPKIEKDERTYRLNDASLFETIMGKDGHSHHGAGTGAHE